jgi:hypothetical protein
MENEDDDDFEIETKIVPNKTVLWYQMISVAEPSEANMNILVEKTQKWRNGMDRQGRHTF